MSDNKILNAVRQLDTSNSNHWTADGLPRIETVRMLAGDASLVRETVEASAPGFNRTNAKDYKAEGEETAGVQGGGQPEIVVTPPQDVDGQAIPQPEPRPTAPPADGSAMVGEPTAPEGSQALPGTVHAEQASPAPADPDQQMPPEIAQGTTTQGFNALATPESDIADALATTAPSPNAPEALGGPLADDSRGRAADVSGGVGEAQLDTLDDDEHVDPSDALKALEEELAEASAYSDKLRGVADQVAAELHRSSVRESDLRMQIEATRPRNHTSHAIQDYFAKQDAAAEQLVDARKAIADSGVDLKVLNSIAAGAPIDQAVAKSNAAS